MTDNFSDEVLLLPDVSIIIPVYRVEKYLSYCLDSIGHSPKKLNHLKREFFYKKIEGR